MNPLAVQTMSGSLLETLGFAAMVMTLMGVWFQWHRPAHLADVEEDLKDGRLLPEQAQRRARRISVRATTCVLAGMTLLLLVGAAWVQGR